MQTILTIAWLPFILSLLALAGALGVIVLIQQLRNLRRLSVEQTRTAWAIELLSSYQESEVSAHLQDWGIETAIRYGLMPAHLTLWRWEAMGRNPWQLLQRLQSRYATLSYQKGPRWSVFTTSILRREHV